MQVIVSAGGPAPAPDQTRVILVIYTGLPGKTTRPWSLSGGQAAAGSSAMVATASDHHWSNFSCSFAAARAGATTK
ncbi:hypothetical protein RE0327_48940 (plasmid) [Prescottella equi]|nr:hypothetical protein RE0327_48940 [Prescottella equi]